jgi:hypothetical protein
MVEVKHNGQL